MVTKRCRARAGKARTREDKGAWAGGDGEEGDGPTARAWSRSPV
jgi:hypothetical protein